MIPCSETPGPGLLVPMELMQNARYESFRDENRGIWIWPGLRAGGLYSLSRWVPAPTPREGVVDAGPVRRGEGKITTIEPTAQLRMLIRARKLFHPTHVAMRRGRFLRQISDGIKFATAASPATSLSKRPRHGCQSMFCSPFF